ncbi:uncharacterized protein CEXT_353651 [Caerostris extrusa]|uniref:Uncharacterized protein n=1 Tax=Caerostris extrusa TaxID=172846 RepID=A0AAV4QPM7_CAEEX|nr:uncharacterized protein CEXT_353651 [Caerostris extrusa]
MSRSEGLREKCSETGLRVNESDPRVKFPRSSTLSRAMGSAKSLRRAPCCYAAYFALGFVVSALTLATMFWILWCYLGLSAVQLSDSQRRAIVSYSYTTPKPPTTPKSVNNRTEGDVFLETSLNSISKSEVTASTLLRNREELAKGDFAARPGQNTTKRESQVSSSGAIPSEDKKGSILNGGVSEGVHTRRVSTSNTENRDLETKLSSPDIQPTQTYDSVRPDGSAAPPTEHKRPLPKDSDRSDQNPRPIFRDPDFERDPPSRTRDPARRRYDDDERDRGTRYDNTDRRRDSDDAYSKGDTRINPILDDRYRPREDGRRRGDDRDDRDDRYRHRDEGRYRDDERYREDRYRDDRYRDDERYKEDRYRDDRYRDDERYREDRYRDDERYKEDRYRDDRYRGDARYRDDDRYPSSDGSYRYRDEDRSRAPAFDDRRDKDRYSPKEENDRYSISKDRGYRDSISSSRSEAPPERRSRRPSDDYDSVRDRPRPSVRDERVDDRYSNRDEEYRRSSPYDDRSTITPTRVRDETYVSRTHIPLSLSRDEAYTSRSTMVDDRIKDNSRYSGDSSRSKYSDDDRKVDKSRFISPSSLPEAENTRRDEHRSRLSGDRKSDTKYNDRDDGVILDHRSYGSEEDDAYRTQNYDDRDRRSSGESRRNYPDDDEYPKRTKARDDEYPTRTRTRDDEYPTRTRTRDDEYPTRTRKREDEYPTRTRTRDDEYPPRTRTRDDEYLKQDDDEYPRRTRARDDEYPKRDDEEYPKRTRTRDDEYPKRTRIDEDERPKRIILDDDQYPKRTRTDDDEYRRTRQRGDNESDRNRNRDRHDLPYDDRHIDDDDDRSSSRKYSPEYENTRRRDDTDIGLRKDSSPRDLIDDDRRSRSESRLPTSASNDKDRRHTDGSAPRRPSIRDSMSEDRRQKPDDRPSVDKYPDDSERQVPPRSEKRYPFTSPPVVREKRYENSRSDSSERRPLSAKDVIEAAQRQPDLPEQNSRKVFYPVYDPRAANLTSPDIIRPSERKGTTILSRKKRSSLI